MRAIKQHTVFISLKPRQEKLAKKKTRPKSRVKNRD
jgi:hypothetical protein